MISPWICDLEEETWAMKKSLKNIGHMKVQIYIYIYINMDTWRSKYKKEIKWWAHEGSCIKKREEGRKIAMFQNNKL